MEHKGIDYKGPIVTLLNASPLWVAEVAGRTAYDSFDNSEHVGVKLFPTDQGAYFKHNPDIESSELLHSLAWVHHHHSVIELVDISFSIKGTSRGVLQEHARHRIQSLTVRSTRYTMSSVIHAFVASHKTLKSKDWFINKIKEMDILVVSGAAETYEAAHLYEKFYHQMIKLGQDEFRESAIAKSSIELLDKRFEPEELFKALETGKKKRNVGDTFKWIVTDNWKVDMIVKFNLRSLKNYLDLRNSGAAFFQIQWLAKAIIDVTPDKYKDLIIKRKK